MKQPISWLCVLFLGLSAAGAAAQDDAEHAHSIAGPIGFNFGLVLDAPLGDTAERIDVGTGFTAGVGFRPHPMVGVRLDYLFSWHNVDGDILDASNLEGVHSLQVGSVSVVVHPYHYRGFGFYVIAGGGLYYRTVDITQLEGVGVGTYCDPYLGFCYPTAVPVSSIVGSRSETDFGLSGGLGMYFMIDPPVRLYLEARYNFIFGPEFTDADGDSQHANGQYLPIVLGVAF
jgi:hypothetical protein